MYERVEPKVTYIFQAVRCLNAVLDSWEDAIQHHSLDNERRLRKSHRVSWKIAASPNGLTVHCDMATLTSLLDALDLDRKHAAPDRPRMLADLKKCAFAIWEKWTSQNYRLMPQDYPLDISEDLTDTLVELYCTTPCCGDLRLPIIDLDDFWERYRDPIRKPSKLLIYAVCAMAARNAFQIHIWNKRPAHESPRYNMGKALSVAYCKVARDMLADSFDEPSMDTCLAAFILSYCSHQNGYPGVIYTYEWISFTMANELGLYDKNRPMTSRETLLVWCLYYFNTWYRVLQGGSTVSLSSSQFYPHQPLPDLPCEDVENRGTDYYILGVWSLLIRTQIQRDKIMSLLVKSEESTMRDWLDMHREVESLVQTLPTDWQRPNYSCRAGTLAESCILQVHMELNINRILLCSPFITFDRDNPHTCYCLYVCMQAAYFITCAVEALAQQCSAPVVGLLFAQNVYLKLLENPATYDAAKQQLKRCVDIAKTTTSYIYDFEMTRVLVDLLERNVP